MPLVDHNTFLKHLSNLFESTKAKGTIWLTHKRLSYDGEDVKMKEGNDSDSREYPCIVRLTDGNKIKVSTKIMSTDLHKFHSAYGTLLKSSMTSLRKRDKKREKQRAEQIAKRKQRVVEPVIGPKRGNGRRKRQRQIKAVVKHQEIKERTAKREEAKTKS